MVPICGGFSFAKGTRHKSHGPRVFAPYIRILLLDRCFVSNRFQIRRPKSGSFRLLVGATSLIRLKMQRAYSEKSEIVRSMFERQPSKKSQTWIRMGVARPGFAQRNLALDWDSGRT